MRGKIGMACCVGATVLACAGFGIAGNMRENTAAVKTLTLVPNTVSNHVLCRGKLEYGVEYAVGVDRTARVIGSGVEEGDIVARGDALMTLEPEEGLELGGGFDVQGEILSVFSSFVGSSPSEKASAEPCIAALEDDGRQTLYSPAGGIVTKVSGNGVAAAESALVTIADPASLRICAAIPEAYVQDLAVGMPCTITGDAFRDRSYNGTVEKIMAFAYQSTSLTGAGDTVVDVLVSIDEPDEALRAGYNAQIEIRTDWKENALLVPYEAVMQDETNTEYVLVAENGCAVRRNVRTGYELDDAVELAEGCRAGERVILNPEGIRENARIREERTAE
ncbi:MAG: HlyD family efflux transporter periplasmic adaptor subunit [Eubacteriales bacterium]|nr:HlyD family efflux transporter periplasmic adaptor subunit [Eubacteriales bacterium]